MSEINDRASRNERVLVTTLTKRMAEDLTEFMHEAGLRVRYMHSDVETLERIELIRDLRLGVYDVLVGINLLREGLDIPECGLVAILDADKEGFLRSETSLVQTIGRAARNVDGRVILYADRMTGSMERAIKETDRRREKQDAYNKANGITPETIKRDIADIVAHAASKDSVTVDTGDEDRNNLVGHNLRSYIEDLEKRMREAAADLEFEINAGYVTKVHAVCVLEENPGRAIRCKCCEKVVFVADCNIASRGAQVRNPHRGYDAACSLRNRTRRCNREIIRCDIAKFQRAGAVKQNARRTACRACGQVADNGDVVVERDRARCRSERPIDTNGDITAIGCSSSTGQDGIWIIPFTRRNRARTKVAIDVGHNPARPSGFLTRCRQSRSRRRCEPVLQPGQCRNTGISRALDLVRHCDLQTCQLLDEITIAHS